MNDWRAVAAADILNEEILTNMTSTQFAEYLMSVSQNSNAFSSEFNSVIGNPDLYILSQFVESRRTQSFINATDDELSLWNEVWRRSRAYALSLPVGRLERRIFFALANEPDIITTPPPPRRVIRGPPAMNNRRPPSSPSGGAGSAISRRLF